MGMSIRAIQKAAGYKGTTPVCSNCTHEQREQQGGSRFCGLHGFYVRYSGTCNQHDYRSIGGPNGTSQR